MDWDDVFPWFALATFGAFGLSLKSFLEARSLRAEFSTLAARVRTLDAQLQPPQIPSAIVESAAAPAPAAGSVPESVTAAEAPELPVTQQLPPADSGNRWEQVLAENWLVWLGGLALALGGGFLVKLSVDYGLLTPPVRVVLGVLLGVGLSLGADWVARREHAVRPTEAGSSYVPQALAAAGAATVFASLYAAYQLYDLLSASLAFPLLA